MIDDIATNVLLREELPDVWDALKLSDLLLESKNHITTVNNEIKPNDTNKQFAPNDTNYKKVEKIHILL